MPELPEVETMRRGLQPIIGSRIIAAQRPASRFHPIQLRPRIDHFHHRVKDRAIESIGRRGKRIMIVLDDGQTVVIEPRMTGLVLLGQPPGEEHLRFRLTLADRRHRELLFWDRRGLGTVRLFRPAELLALVEARLGPDALQIDPLTLRQSLAASRRAIKVALLDQAVLAGIGNLYASEILFTAGIDPRTRCDRLSGPQWRRLHEQIGVVLREAIAFEGSTLRDGTYRNALNNPGSYQNCHRVYDHAGQICSRCHAGAIRRVVQAQRSTFFCPVCQRKSGVHPSLRQR